MFLMLVDVDLVYIAIDIRSVGECSIQPIFRTISDQRGGNLAMYLNNTPALNSIIVYLN